MKNLILDCCTELNVENYLNLKDPIFKVQTKLDSNNMYWIVVESEGVFYKIHCKL